MGRFFNENMSKRSALIVSLALEKSNLSAETNNARNTEKNVSNGL